MQSKLFEDVVEKEFGNSYGVHCFWARGKNYPLTKAMVTHDHDKIEVVDWEEVYNKIHGEVLEEAVTCTK